MPTVSKPPATDNGGERGKGSGKETRVTGPRKIVLDTLAAHGGVIEDPDGQATIKLFEAMGRDDITIKALQNSLGKMTERGLVVRDVRGKRTYSISLPDQPRGREASRGSASATRGRARRAPVDRSGSEGIDYAALATALLTRIAEILAAGDPSQMADVLERLGEQTERTQHQARKLLEMAEELGQARSQRDELQGKLAVLESNVRAILKGDQVPDTRALRELERWIAAPPKRR